MENSPPEIHTIPCGDCEGAAAVRGTVVPNAKVSAVPAIGWPASTLLAGERGHGRNTATATAARIMVSAMGINTGRCSFERLVTPPPALVRLFCVMRA